MKTLLSVLVALVLAACCQNSQAWFNGGTQAMLSNYPAKGTQCERKARIAAKVAEDARNGVQLSTYDIETAYNFGALDPDIVAILMSFALSYKNYRGYPNQAYHEVVSLCRAGKY